MADKPKQVKRKLPKHKETLLEQILKAIPLALTTAQSVKDIITK